MDSILYILIIGTFTSFYFIIYINLPSTRQNRILAQYEEKIKELPNSSDLESIISQVLNVVLSSETEEEKELTIEPRSENVADYLRNFICNMSPEVDRDERNLLGIQHMIAKDLFHWEEVGDRLENCQDYQANFSTFLQVKV